MSLDRVPFVTNEQYASADLNALQTIWERYQHDAGGFPCRARELTETGDLAVAAVVPPAVLLGGLEAASDGSTALLIEPGALAVTSFPADPGETPLSTYKLALNPTQASVTLPSPGADTWYIVGGRPVVEDDPVELRRVWNSSAPGFEDQNLVKRQRAAMVFEVVEGTATDLPLTMPTDTVPLYAVFRPAGGGAIDDATQVIDLCPLPSTSRLANTGRAEIAHSTWRMTTTLTINVHAFLDGLELHASVAGLDPLDVKNPDDADPVFADQQWWYLYLAPFSALGPLCCPRHAQFPAGALRQQGLLVFSKTAPAGPGSRTNSAALTAPAPFSDAEIPIGGAICVAQLYWKQTAWIQAWALGDTVALQPVSGIGFTFSTVAFNARAPVGARFVDYLLQASSSEDQALELRNTASTLAHYYAALTIPDGDSTLVIVDLYAHTIPIPENGQFLPVHSGTAVTWTASVLGYRF